MSDVGYRQLSAKSSRGFTLLEFLLVIAVLAIVMVAIIMVWAGYQRTQALESSTRDLVTMLREAQGNAIARVNDANWGVHITNNASAADTAELFWNNGGTTYVPANATRSVTLSSSIDLTPFASGQTRDIVFSERFGTLVGGTAGGTAEWVSYRAQAVSDLRAARYVAAGGQTSCQGGDPQAAYWDCFTVDGDGGINVSGDHPMMLDAEGKPWTVYAKPEGGSSDNLWVAQYVGDGSGSGCASNPASEGLNWRCSEVDDRTGVLASDNGLGFGSDGNARIAYLDGSPDSLVLAQYVGGGSGSGCTNTNWSCFTVDDPPVNLLNEIFGMVFDGQNRPWISYTDESVGALKVARDVGSSGTGCAGGPANWSCVVVDDGPGAEFGENNSLAMDAQGEARVTYFGGANGDLRMAEYVGVNGSGCTPPNAEWTCYSIDRDSADPTVERMGYFSSVAFDANGVPWVAYSDDDIGALRLARYVEAGGTGCDADGNGVTGDPSDWTCFTLDDTPANVGDRISLAFDSNNNARILYHANPDYAKIAEYVGSGGSGCVNNPESAKWRCYILENVGGNGGIASNMMPGQGGASNQTIELFNVSQTGQRRTILVFSSGGIEIQ